MLQKKNGKLKGMFRAQAGWIASVGKLGMALDARMDTTHCCLLLGKSWGSSLFSSDNFILGLVSF